MSMDRKFYNKELKKRFLEKYSEEAREYASRILSIAYDLEMNKNRDLAEFDSEELFSLIKGLKMKSLHSIHTVVSVIRTYIDYAIENSQMNIQVNNANIFSGKEKLSELLNMQAVSKSYMTRDQLHNILEFTNNAQDSALFGLIFEGAKPFDELINLKKADVNFETGEVLLTKDDSTQRVLLIKDILILESIRDAIHQETYLKNNGYGEYLRTPDFDLADSEYVFRVSGKVKVDKVTERTLRERINKICKLYGLEIRKSNSFEAEYLNPKNIWLSGMIDFGKKIKAEEDREILKKEYYVKINERFGYDTKYWYSTKRIIEEFL